HSLGALAQGRGDHARAVSYYGEALIRFHALGDLGSVAWCLEGVAAAGGRDHPEQAARLFAAADTLRTAIHIPLPSPERPEYDRAVAVVRTILGDAAFEAAWRDGAVLPLETALAAANALAASQ
ncbi:MAG: AfsR/SARP family transcriptional regulator, partial [Chloroflexota bacterium]|nr:AfsR/SARP family transcriptional regulator [Chloroflexota bacterium]